MKFAAALTAIGLTISPGRKLRISDRVNVAVTVDLGPGTIIDISTESEPGGGTKLYPAFHVRFDDGLTGWFNGTSITHLKN